MPLAPTEEMLTRAREALPELPAARVERYERELGLAADTARLLAFAPRARRLLRGRAGRRRDGAEPRASPTG